MYRLFIVEDDPGIANAVAAQAQAWNLQTHIVSDFGNVMHEFAEFSPHIVLPVSYTHLTLPTNREV